MPNPRDFLTPTEVSDITSFCQKTQEIVISSLSFLVLCEAIITYAAEYGRAYVYVNATNHTNGAIFSVNVFHRDALGTPVAKRVGGYPTFMQAVSYAAVYLVSILSSRYFYNHRYPKNLSQ